MASALDKYVKLIRNLLPTGFAWENVRQHPFLTGIAGEFCRVGDRTEDLLREIDPNQTVELIEEWETTFGIPDECTPDTILTIEERRAQVIQKMATIGSLSAEFYEGIGALYGFDITVENHLSFQVGRSVVGDDLTNYDNPRDIFRVGQNTVGDQLQVPGWLHCFNAELPATAFETFKVGQNTVNQPLATFGNELLECVLRRLKPAHSCITFTFK